MISTNSVTYNTKPIETNDKNLYCFQRVVGATKWSGYWASSGKRDGCVCKYHNWFRVNGTSMNTSRSLCFIRFLTDAVFFFFVWTQVRTLCYICNYLDRYFNKTRGAQPSTYHKLCSHLYI